MKPEVSVITTVYNGETTIEHTLQSIEAQTFRDFELIIVNDGSTDHTNAIIEKFKEEHPQMKILTFHLDRIGRAKALNYAIKHATAPYIANIDGDDLWETHHLEEQLENIKHSKYGLICSDYYLQIGDSLSKQNDERTDFQVRDITKKLGRYNPINHSSVIYRKSIVDSVGGYNENLKKLLDYDLWLRMKQHQVKIGFYPRKTCVKRIHKHQSYENKNPVDYAMKILKMSVRSLVWHRDFFGLFYALSKFFYGLTPQLFRQSLKKALFGK